MRPPSAPRIWPAMAGPPAGGRTAPPGPGGRRGGGEEPALERLPVDDLVELGLCVDRARGWRVGEPRSHSRDGDAVRAKRPGQYAHDSSQCALARDVGQQHRGRRGAQKIRGDTADTRETW